jgi:hypothetical protein
MSNPIQIQIRGTSSVREWWMKAKGQYDMTHGELAVAMCKFALQREAEFRRFNEGTGRPREGE